MESDSYGMYFIIIDLNNEEVVGYIVNFNYVFKDKVKMGGGYILFDCFMFLELFFMFFEG